MTAGRHAPYAAKAARADTSHIRFAKAADIPRIAEILVFTKRVAYRPIFCDDVGSFCELTVLGTIAECRENRLDGTLLYDDGVVKGMLRMSIPDGAAEAALNELYVEPFFQGEGIGAALMGRFLNECGRAGAKCARLWVLEANAPARKFYEAFGFLPDGRMQCVPGTDVREIGYVKKL